jgi:hypothetical protein
MMAMQYDVKQAHLNGSGIFVVGPTRIKGISLTGTATAGQLVVFDTLTAPVTTGTYGRSGTTVTVTQSAHGLANGQVIGIDFAAGTGGTATNGNYAVTVLTSSTFTITDINSGSITAGAAMVYSTGKWLITYDVAAGDTYNNAPFIPGEGVRADNGLYGYITNLTAANIYYG